MSIQDWSSSISKIVDGADSVTFVLMIKQGEFPLPIMLDMQPPLVNLLRAKLLALQKKKKKHSQVDFVTIY